MMRGTLKFMRMASRRWAALRYDSTCAVHALQALDGLQLEDDRVLDDQVRVEIADAIALEEHRHRHLRAKGDRASPQLAFHRTLIDRLELPRADVFVDFDRSTDDLPRQLGVDDALPPSIVAGPLLRSMALEARADLIAEVMVSSFLALTRW